MAARKKQESPTLEAMLRNMLDGDGQDQFDAGGWCFPKPIPPVQRNGEWIVSTGPTKLFFLSLECEWKTTARNPLARRAACAPSPALTYGRIAPDAPQVMEPMGAAKCNEAFEENLREYPGEKYPKKKQEWMSVQGGSILTICKLHPTQRPPMVRPEDDNELGQQDVEVHTPRAAKHGMRRRPAAALSVLLPAMPALAHGRAAGTRGALAHPRLHSMQRALSLTLAVFSFCVCFRSASSAPRHSSRIWWRMGSRWSRRGVWARARCLRTPAAKRSKAPRRASTPTTSTASGDSTVRCLGCEEMRTTRSRTSCCVLRARCCRQPQGSRREGVALLLETRSDRKQERGGRALPRPCCVPERREGREFLC